MITRPYSLLAALVTSALLAGTAIADSTGVTPGGIKLGQAAVFDGPAAPLGVGMRLGLRAAFEEANRAGGVNGRKIEFITRDDGYEPNRSLEAVKQLIEQDKVFALVGPVGTPTTVATMPVAEQAEVPMIGPFTGAEALRVPFRPWLINLRASYFQETEEMVERLTKDLGVSKIAIFFQDDAFGRAGLAGVQKAMDKRAMKLVAEGTYERNTTAVRSALLTIRGAAPEAIIMVGAPAPCAEFIKLARQIKLEATFVNISFVGADALAAALGDKGAGVIVTQVVPLPTDTAIPLVAKYQAALKTVDSGAAPGFISLEGYAVGRLMLEALQRAGADPDRKKLIGAIQGMSSLDLGGLKLAFGPQNHQGSNQVFVTVLGADGQFKQVEKLTR
jgi:ABC-type branched-subunit amino acid transport system substrate-binding protein